MAHDPVIVDEQTFYSMRHKVSDKLVQKIKGLLDGYECFEEQLRPAKDSSHAPNPPPHHTHHLKRYDNFRRRHHHTTHAKQRTVLGGGSKNGRQLTSLLNKISARNFDKLVKQILVMSEVTPMHEIVEPILLKCHQQICFLDLYVQLLKGLFRASDDNGKKEIKESVGNYIDSVTNNNLDASSFSLQTRDYDDFCQNITYKATTIGKHKAVLAFLFLGEPDMISMAESKAQNYFNVLFERARAIGEQEKETRNNDAHELVLEMLLDCLRFGRAWNDSLHEYFAHPDRTKTYSAKARFKLMDAMQ